LGRAAARLVAMSSNDTIARALALAFLAGGWTHRELRERGAVALGEPVRWLRPLSVYVLERFPNAPQDAPDRLRDAILQAPIFQRALRPGEPRPHLARLLVGEAAMGARPWPVPSLPTTRDLADFLELQPSELDWFADVLALNAETPRTALQHYSFRWLAKKRGGYRLLEAPKTRLKQLQRRVLHDVLDRVPPHDAAHGFVRGRSVLSCARLHSGQQLLLRLDLHDFFPSVGPGRVYRIFRRLGYPELVARALTGLCTLETPAHVFRALPPLTFAEQLDRGAIDARSQARRRLRQRHLPQGAPTSPALANLAAYRLDVRLSGLARAYHAHYTRYADDLAFSGNADFARRAGKLEPYIAAIALEEGFRVNHHKTRTMTQAQSQRLLGLTTNQQPAVPRAEREKLEAILTNISRHGWESQNREGAAGFAERLRGKVAHVESAHAPHGKKLRRLLEQCDESRR
jgi:RNA-directed DNA polymerase